MSDENIKLSINDAPLSIGQHLLNNNLISQKQLEDALNHQKKSGEKLGRILVAHRSIHQAHLDETLAQINHLPFSSFQTAEIDATLFNNALFNDYCNYLFIPIKKDINGIILTIALSDPTNNSIDYIKKIYKDQIVTLVVIARTELFAHIHFMTREILTKKALYAMSTACPGLSVFNASLSYQLLGFYLFLSLFLFLLFYFTFYLFLSINIFFTIFLIINFCFKFLLIWLGSSAKTESQITKEEVDALIDSELPIYTIIAPMYKEPDVLPSLVQALRQMDYPLEKLDIKIILEEDDLETQEIAKGLNLEGIFDIL